jgi:tRNA 2-selenouridine synthase
MATVLSQVGWRTGLLRGGYKTYRRRVVGRLYDAELPHRLVLLGGNTGSGKTELLGLAQARGVQVVDLEGLAAHRGSLFGEIAGRAQPSQKMFESRLLAAFEALDPGRPVLVEAESSKIGERFLPPSVWGAMTAAARIEMAAPAEARAGYLVEVYRDISADREALHALLQRLPRTTSRKQVEAWRALADEGRFRDLAHALLVEHYDPAYRRSAGEGGQRPLAVVAAPRLDRPGLAAAADEIARIVSGCSARCSP